MYCYFEDRKGETFIIDLELNFPSDSLSTKLDQQKLVLWVLNTLIQRVLFPPVPLQEHTRSLHF